jgi:histidyl-tRNA synthetase
MLGAVTPECDAEMIAIAVSFFQAVGLGADQVRIGVNSRRLMNEKMDALELPQKCARLPSALLTGVTR